MKHWDATIEIQHQEPSAILIEAELGKVLPQAGIFVSCSMVINGHVVDVLQTELFQVKARRGVEICAIMKRGINSHRGDQPISQIYCCCHGLFLCYSLSIPARRRRSRCRAEPMVQIASRKEVLGTYFNYDAF